MCDSRHHRRFSLDSLLSSLGHRRASARSHSCAQPAYPLAPIALQTRLTTASQGRSRTQPSVPDVHTYRPSLHPDRKNRRSSDSIPIVTATGAAEESFRSGGPVCTESVASAHAFSGRRRVGDSQRRHQAGESRCCGRPWQLDVLRQRNRWKDRGGAAKLHCFLQRCGVEPFGWFRDVLSRIPAHSIARLSELLPHNWKPVFPPAQA
jgi:hypothetical protein